MNPYEVGTMAASLEASYEYYFGKRKIRKQKMLPNNHPFDECADAAAALILEGATIHQKYTCTACGSRQTMSEPNKFFTEGKCEECSHITNIQQTGCNYLVIWSSVTRSDHKGVPQ